MIVTGTTVFYDPVFCDNRQDLPNPQNKPIHEQIEIFCNEPSNNVVNIEKINLQQLSPSTWMMIYQKFVEDKK